MIEIEYDFRNDSRCGDPDADSQKLYEAHKILWNKRLPCGKEFDLNILNGNSSRILLSNKLCDNLSSDRMCPHFIGNFKNKYDKWLPESENEELKKAVRTIGGHIIFPAHRRDGFTINQARGVNRKISDRFDLTLECIRRFYKNEDSPLDSSLERYRDFLDLFVDFDGYADFFLLQDFVDENCQVKFALPFDNFNRSALPQDIAEFQQYKEKTVESINRRNARISKAIN